MMVIWIRDVDDGNIYLFTEPQRHMQISRTVLSGESEVVKGLDVNGAHHQTVDKQAVEQVHVQPLAYIQHFRVIIY